MFYSGVRGVQVHIIDDATHLSYAQLFNDYYTILNK